MSDQDQHTRHGRDGPDPCSGHGWVEVAFGTGVRTLFQENWNVIRVQKLAPI